jgi:hypothetical protein
MPRSNDCATIAARNSALCARRRSPTISIRGIRAATVAANVVASSLSTIRPRCTDHNARNKASRPDAYLVSLILIAALRQRRYSLTRGRALVMTWKFPTLRVTRRATRSRCASLAGRKQHIGLPPPCWYPVQKPAQSTCDCAWVILVGRVQDVKFYQVLHLRCAHVERDASETLGPTRPRKAHALGRRASLLEFCRFFHFAMGTSAMAHRWCC